MELLKALERHGYLTDTNVRVLEHFSQKWKVNSYLAILETHIMSDQALADAIADIFKLDRIYSFDISDFDSSCLGLVSFSDSQRFQFLIPSQDEDGTLQVYILSPLDIDIDAYLRAKFSKFRFVVLDRRLMARALDEFYPLLLQVPSLSKI